MASATIVVDKMGANHFDRNLVLIIQCYAISFDCGDFELVIDIKDHILCLLIYSTEQCFSNIIFVRLLQYLLTHSSADGSASPVCICDVGDCVALLHNFEIFLERFNHWDLLVEDVVLEILQNFALPRILQPLALAQIDIVRKDQIDTSIEIFVVIVLIGYQIDRFELIRIASCYHYFIWLFLAKSLNSS